MKDNTPKIPIRPPAQPPPKYVPEHVRLGVKPISMPVAPSAPASEMYFADETAFNDSGDETSIPDGEVIDNNDFVNLGPYDRREEVQPQQVEDNTEQISQETPKVGDYILMVSNRMVMSGTLHSIESKVKAIVYGDDEEFASVEVSTDDIVVLKRLNIRVGVFIEE